LFNFHVLLAVEAVAALLQPIQQCQQQQVPNAVQSLTCQASEVWWSGQRVAGAENDDSGAEKQRDL